MFGIKALLHKRHLSFPKKTGFVLFLPPNIRTRVEGIHSSVPLLSGLVGSSIIIFLLWSPIYALFYDFLQVTALMLK